MHPQRIPRPTMKDVARAADVSLSTVSYILNGGTAAQRITSRTKERVLKAVESLGYKFNPIGRDLQRGYTSQVTLLIVTWNLATSHAATAMAVSRAAARHRLAVNVHVADDDHSAEQFIRREALHSLGGILVLWDSPAFTESSLCSLAAQHVPIIDLLPNSPVGVSTVTANREDAAYRATRHLLELGHQHIGVICDSLQRPKTTSHKLAGYRRALESSCLPYCEELVQNETEFGFEAGRHGWRTLTQRRPNVTALFCINDAIALGAIDAAHDEGRVCPRDFSVIGYGDAAESRYWRPQLTTFGLSSERVATEAIRLVLEQRTAQSLEGQCLMIPEELIVRGSTGPAKRRL